MGRGKKKEKLENETSTSRVLEKLCFVKSEAICRGGGEVEFTLNGANRTTRRAVLAALARAGLFSPFECEMSRDERERKLI